MISVICVYNNKEILDEFLLKSLNQQTVDYELILINNTENKYKSASKALNNGGNNAKGNYLMFVHQDVDLKSIKWLEKVEKSLDSLDKLGIAGIAGVVENEYKVLSNIENGIPPEPAGIRFNYPKLVQTVDECLFIIPKSVFDKYKFDENLGGWHLYSVDYCLNMNKLHYNVYIIPIYAYHQSYAYSMSKNYYIILKKIFNKYNKDYNHIHTTCGVWNTSYPIFLHWIINSRIGKLFYKLLK